MRCCLAAFIVLAASLAAASPAEAALKLCNRTSYILYAATATVTNSGAATHGWTRIAPGDCETALPGKLRTQSYLVYARSALAASGPGRAWGGDIAFCVRDGAFTLPQKAVGGACTGDAFSAAFASLDTHGRPDWTMTFDDDPRLASLQDAQLAGAKRLLKDNGYAIAAIDAKPDKTTGAALSDFRKKMKFADRDGNEKLFKALESEAATHGAPPEGLTVCNDTRSDAIAALGQSVGGDFISRGWWRMAAGACARAITTPLKDDAVWLAVQKPGGAALVTGPDQFCVAAQEFEIKARGNCPARGYTAAGFARVAVRGKSGVLIHVDAKGLAVPQAEISK
ncbi:MAG TPA: DUF1036 domain-containing protein [Rhizomicrobium sp.]|jgi:uncharacterized membrane protein|nr:DUF1036 domain-containing protein [Rhizomicrobium sp.]